MKKIIKGLSILFLFAVALNFTACGNIAALLGNPTDDNGNTQQQQGTDDNDDTSTLREYTEVTSGEAINHEFYLSQDMTNSYKYFTSTQAFIYTANDGTVYDATNPCIYQISFKPTNSAETKGKWSLYTRPKASPKTIELIFQGTYEGNVKQNGGQVKLYIENNLIQTLNIEKKVIQLEKTSPDTYVFTANMKAAHTAIGATDAK